MVNDPLFESERNIEARQSKTPKKKRSITGISKIDRKLIFFYVSNIALHFFILPN